MMGDEEESTEQPVLNEEECPIDYLWLVKLNKSSSPDPYFCRTSCAIAEIIDLRLRDSWDYEYVSIITAS